jgi:hypothetical protein
MIAVYIPKAKMTLNKTKRENRPKALPYSTGFDRTSGLVYDGTNKN